MREALHTEQVHFMAPEGWMSRVHETAREEGMTASEFMRSAIRDKLAEAEDARP